jgi:hypothetical protein
MAMPVPRGAPAVKSVDGLATIVWLGCLAMPVLGSCKPAVKRGRL